MSPVIASEAKQSSFAATRKLDRFVALLPRNDGERDEPRDRQATSQPLNARQYPQFSRLIRQIWRKCRQKQAASGIAGNQEAILSVRYYDWIAHFSRRTPDKIALVDLASGRRLSYSQLNDRASRGLPRICAMR